MKPKKLKRKLSLNKKTIADLSNGNMGLVLGGRPATSNICPITQCGCPTDTCTCQTCETCQTCAGQYTCNEMMPQCVGLTTDTI